MGLSVSKLRPKYTPPKVCKKAATVFMPTWQFIQCPNVPFLTVKIMWPAEDLLPLPQDTITVSKAARDPGDPCTWNFSGDFASNHFVGFVNFDPIGPELTIAYRRWEIPAITFDYESIFGDYDSRKPKLLLPSNINPDETSYARYISTCSVTI